ncbi:hypothetical protein SAMN05660662_1400 [Blastococcus aurantiacus]|uniref:Putative T7SS secretion signal domain-containing protein n=1 Tax=Blastococcus aurantiacus TaxID=1550231 RepID=A0A1G7JAY8_9ACTN|nr:hypothetical protein [Blastococcus aurantiacus]SDF22046.1 hypothetical protein SAMN05660662_1400 [Blastococcus aurantiacus]
MTRPTDWSPLAGSDPIPGDPDEVDRIGRRYEDTATALRDQAARLRALARDESWDSDAGNEWRHQGREVAEKLDRVVDRYEVAGGALRTYSGELRSAQNRADSALALAKEAEQQARSADNARREQARQHASAPPETPPPDTSHLDRQAENAAADLARARRMLGEAETARDTAATTAAGAIEEITGSDKLNDGRLAGVGKVLGDAVEWLDRNLKQITEWLSNIAAALGVLALLVGWIPVIGQIAAAVLTGLAALASALALIGSIVLALQGRGSWLEVGLNAFSLVTLGIGRAALTGVKLGARGARAAAQASRTDELVSGMVAARGGAHVGGKALRRMTIQARAQAKAQPGMGLTRDQVTDGLAHAATRRPTGLAGAFNPVTIARETGEGMADLARYAAPSNWGNTATLMRNGAAGNPMLDDAARLELARLGQLSDAARATPAVAAYTNSLRWQMGTLTGATFGPIGTDAADKSGALDGLKDRTTFQPR